MKVCWMKYFTCHMYISRKTKNIKKFLILVGKSWETLWKHKTKTHISKFQRREWIAKICLNVIEHWYFTELLLSYCRFFVYLFELDLFIRLMTYFVFHHYFLWDKWNCQPATVQDKNLYPRITEFCLMKLKTKLVLILKREILVQAVLLWKLVHSILHLCDRILTRTCWKLKCEEHASVSVISVYVKGHD